MRAGCDLAPPAYFLSLWRGPNNMHEMSLVHDLVDVVLDESAKHGIAEVGAVHLTIGEGRDIVVEFLEGLFRHLARGTAAANARVVVERVPITVRCRQCGRVFSLNVYDEATWRCPDCGAERDYVLNSGLEFSIDAIEPAA